MPVGLVEERPERGGFVWCSRCPRLWKRADSRAEALWLLEDHVRQAHPEAHA